MTRLALYPGCGLGIMRYRTKSERSPDGGARLRTAIRGCSPRMTRLALYPGYGLGIMRYRTTPDTQHGWWRGRVTRSLR
jgi:hypothetical protein